MSNLLRFQRALRLIAPSVLAILITYESIGARRHEPAPAFLLKLSQSAAELAAGMANYTHPISDAIGRGAGKHLARI